MRVRDMTRPGLRARYSRTAYSLGVSSIGTPPLRTSRLPVSIRKSPIERTAGAVDRGRPANASAPARGAPQADGVGTASAGPQPTPPTLASPAALARLT